ncbi:Abi family protein [Flavobacterium sp. PLA-1-15]|uniref:Abi family protein n=1 Tax=Flavobacterium sp. PLA-1-15 TaxID=3380533 RepID=UPI003B7E7998
MKYTKPSVSIPNQIATLKARGLIFTNEQSAENYLSHISYYRLRAYTYPFQDNSDPAHPFTSQVTFEQIIQLYVFDRKLRLLIFDAIEKVEIAMRTQIIYHFSIKHGAFWHINAALYHDSMRFANQLTSLQTEINRSKETFIDHYKNTYTTPSDPPCWMALEVSSMGLLSQIFQNLRHSEEKKTIARHFGITDVRIFENWMFCFCNLRNICAHHGRVWNRRLVKITIPYNTRNEFINNLNVYPNKLYATLACLSYILNIISPQNDFKQRLKDIIGNCPMLQEHEMGFPLNWEEDAFWS